MYAQPDTLKKSILCRNKSFVPALSLAKEIPKDESDEKILLVGLLTMTALCVCLFVLYGFDDGKKSQNAYIDKARTICLLTESVRNGIEKKWDQGIMTPAQMRGYAESNTMENVLSMVPVVSAWQAAYEQANRMDYTFKVPKFSPRNPKIGPMKSKARLLSR